MRKFVSRLCECCTIIASLALPYPAVQGIRHIQDAVQPGNQDLEQPDPRPVGQAHPVRTGTGGTKNCRGEVLPGNFNEGYSVIVNDLYHSGGSRHFIVIRQQAKP